MTGRLRTIKIKIKVREFIIWGQSSWSADHTGLAELCAALFRLQISGSDHNNARSNICMIKPIGEKTNHGNNLNTPSQPLVLAQILSRPRIQ